jgi:hypothetical protein
MGWPETSAGESKMERKALKKVMGGMAGLLFQTSANRMEIILLTEVSGCSKLWKAVSGNRFPCS